MFWKKKNKNQITKEQFSEACEFFDNIGKKSEKVECNTFDRYDNNGNKYIDLGYCFSEVYDMLVSVKPVNDNKFLLDLWSVLLFDIMKLNANFQSMVSMKSFYNVLANHYSDVVEEYID